MIQISKGGARSLGAEDLVNANGRHLSLGSSLQLWQSFIISPTCFWGEHSGIHSSVVSPRDAQATVLEQPTPVPHMATSTGQSHRMGHMAGCWPCLWLPSGPEGGSVHCQGCVVAARRRNFLHGLQEWAVYLKVRETVFSMPFKERQLWRGSPWTPVSKEYIGSDGRGHGDARSRWHPCPVLWASTQTSSQLGLKLCRGVGFTGHKHLI